MNINLNKYKYFRNKKVQVVKDPIHAIESQINKLVEQKISFKLQIDEINKKIAELKQNALGIGNRLAELIKKVDTL